MTTRRAITLSNDPEGGPYFWADCNDKGWNGYHVPHITAEELADHVYAHKINDPDGTWDDVEVLTGVGEGIVMRTEGGDDLWDYDESGRAWVDGLTWVTARDEAGNDITA